MRPRSLTKDHQFHNNQGCCGRGAAPVQRCGSLAIVPAMALEQEQREWLTLSLVPGVGTAHFIRLLARFRTAANVLQAKERDLREVVGPKLAQRIVQYSDASDIQTQESLIDEYEADLITLNDTRYPLRLAEIYDPPLALFVRGDLREADERSVAIVGTRKATPYGIRTAERLARELAARGVTVVSGLAAGIDAAAHQGAIDAGGRTIAVLGCGVDTVYPAHHADLMHRVIQNGAVVSQFPMGMKPLKGNFPYRNRIISGMTLGTIVVQAPESSGALITAHTALEQGREIFAVPGEVGNRNSAGPHKLIRQGAKLVETADDVLAELELAVDLQQESVSLASVDVVSATTERSPRNEPSPKPVVATQPSANSPQEKSILATLRQDGSFVDEIAQACRISVAEALSALTMLELKGLVRQFSGKRFAPR